MNKEVDVSNWKFGGEVGMLGSIPLAKVYGELSKGVKQVEKDMSRMDRSRLSKTELKIFESMDRLAGISKELLKLIHYLEYTNISITKNLLIALAKEGVLKADHIKKIIPSARELKKIDRRVRNKYK